MPETTGAVITHLYLNKTDISKLIDIIANKVECARLSNGATATKDKQGYVEIEDEQEVTLEFDLSDYAQERDEP